MLKMILKKIMNKKWLAFCLFLGIAFLVATFSCFPMFKAGAINVMINNEFEKSKEANASHPMSIVYHGTCTMDEFASVDEIEAKMNEYRELWKKYFNQVDWINGMDKIVLAGTPLKGTLYGRGGSVNICYSKDMLEHSTILSGTDYNCENGSGGFPVIAPPMVMDEYKYALGETVCYYNTSNDNNEPLKLEVVGVFDVKDPYDLYWRKGPNTDEANIYLSKENFDRVINEYSFYIIDFHIGIVLDYEQVNSQNFDEIIDYVKQIKSVDDGFMINFEDVIKSYQEGKTKIMISIWVLQIPILGMVMAFIFMVSKQILEAEKNEMAMLYSRGLKRRQIIYNYFLQGFIISMVAFICGLPLGYVLCKIAASTKDFLVFDFSRSGLYEANLDMILYGLIAMGIGLVIIIIPSFKNSKVTIVEHKKTVNVKKKMLWEKFFIDIVLLAIAIYLLYNYMKNMDSIRLDALQGKTMDPMIFMDIVMFIVSGGLVALRLCHYLVGGVYGVGRKKWKPAIYASFLQITRNFSRQCFISVFMILTVSMGIFYANAARTVNKNYAIRIEYGEASDAKLAQKWDIKSIYVGDSETYEYIEPDYMQFQNLVTDGICEDITRVINVKDAFVSYNGKKLDNCMMMAFNTKEFGNVANFKDEFNTKNYHWFNYLNELAGSVNNVIISRNIAKHLEVSVGDKIICSKNGDFGKQKYILRGEVSLRVCAIVDNWPGYVTNYYEDGELKENYFIAMNYATAVDNFQIMPYQIWCKFNENVTYEDFYNYINSHEIEYKKLSSIGESVDNLKDNCILQITNGLFTLSFIIAIVLCMIGFLIYWIASIRQRQLLFGIYRAMGMSVREINKMLSNEHLFSTVLSILSGVAVGVLTSKLFTKIFATVYLPEKHNISIFVEYNIMDYVKLGLILVLIIGVCLMCLRRIIKQMDISKSLKLGED